jgi:hypothetical protein
MNTPPRHTARIDRQEMVEIRALPTYPERGRFLWHLLRNKGLDPQRLYTTEYHPHRHCWLLTQMTGDAIPAASEGPLSDPQAERFYLQAATEFHRTALAAFAAVAAYSSHFARFGCKYQLPTEPEVLTPADLVNLLGGSGSASSPARFSPEGGWRSGSSER